MAGFHFRLATLLKLREATRDQRRQQLAQAHQAQQTLQRRKHEKQEEIAALRDEAAALASGAVDVDRILSAQRYEQVLQGEQKVLSEQETTVAEEVERRRLALVAADREVRVLEKLRERQQLEHHRKRERREAKELDETANRAATVRHMS